MGHQLSIVGDIAEMAFTGQKPWHGLGQEVAAGASLEQWLSDAHMQWSYAEKPAQFTHDGEVLEYPDFKILHRSDNLKPLSVVSARYKTVQPKEVVEFFRSLVEREGFTIETLGALKEGRRIWALAKTNIENDVVGSDRLKAHLLLMTSCDGSLATTAKFVSTRVVCWNTQAIALTEDGQSVRVRHNTVFDPESVKKEMGLIGSKSFDVFLGKMRALTKVKLTQFDAQNFVESLLPSSTGGEKDVRESKAFGSIMSLFNGAAKGSDLPGVQGTAWGLLNAVTEYADHHIRARSQENRFESAMFGAGSVLKAKAESELVLLA
jgi:phage/plasmid-like protein (TIGR03299 family)